jgi:DNA-binding winged helix-turn-helix (wHTH) protein
MRGKMLYKFGAFRFDAERCLLRRIDNKPIKILKQKVEKPEAKLGRSLCPLLLSFLNAAIEKGGDESVLSEKDLIKAVWPVPNPNAEIAKNTLKRTVGQLKKIFKDNDPKERSYIRDVNDDYQFTFSVKRIPAYAPVVSVEAKEHYAWGRHLLDTFTTEEGLQKAIEEFQKAYKLVPYFAAAYAHETFAYLWLSIFSWRAPQDTLPQALQASAQALSLDDTLGVAYAARAFAILFSESDRTKSWKEAEILLEKAIYLDKKHDQNFEAVYQMDALRLTALRQFSKAHLTINRSLEINPVSFISNVLKALVHFVSRNYQSCDDHLQEINALESDIDAAYYVRVLVCIYKGEPDKALWEIKQGEKMAEGNILYRLLLAYWQAIWGSKDDALMLLEELDEESKRRYISPYHRALPYVHIDMHKAIERLEQAALDKDPWVLLLKVDPRVDLLRRNERFISLLHSAP